MESVGATVALSSRFSTTCARRSGKPGQTPSGRVLPRKSDAWVALLESVDQLVKQNGHVDRGHLLVRKLGVDSRQLPNPGDQPLQSVDVAREHLEKTLPFG